MQLRLILNIKTWQARTPQSGSETGWSDWFVVGRQFALDCIESGHTYETLERLP